MIGQRDEVIACNRKTKSSIFVTENPQAVDNEDYTIFRLEDVVEFNDFPHISNRRLTGVIKKLGWSNGPCGAYITIGVKVDDVEFGTALLYNYTLIPTALTKIK